MRMLPNALAAIESSCMGRLLREGAARHLVTARPLLQIEPQECLVKTKLDDQVQHAQVWRSTVPTLA